MQLEEILTKYGFEITCVSFVVLPLIIVSSIKKGFQIYDKYIAKKQEAGNDTHNLIRYRFYK